MLFRSPQFKSINSLALNFLYGPTLTSIHDYWKNHSFDFAGKVISLLFNMLSRFVIKLVKFVIKVCFNTEHPALRALCVCPWRLTTSSQFPLCEVGVAGPEHQIVERAVHPPW